MPLVSIYLLSPSVNEQPSKCASADLLHFLRLVMYPTFTTTKLPKATPISGSLISK